MISCSTAQGLRAALRTRPDGRRVGLVPTMGYLHEGHASLIREARGRCETVVVSIFVNPLQFGPAEDYEKYPRDLERDRALCEREGADIVFHPSAAEMYRGGRPLTTVHVAELGDGLCGRSRPGHFDGVCTVVSKLLHLVNPTHAFFGEKDWQQLQIVRQMARDLSFPAEIVGCPIVREPDGLALSSRNAYLSREERDAAAAIPRVLSGLAAAVRQGNREISALLEDARRDLEDGNPLLRVDYLSFVDPETLRPLSELRAGQSGLFAAAVYAGATRLIDNALCKRPE